MTETDNPGSETDSARVAASLVSQVAQAARAGGVPVDAIQSLALPVERQWDFDYGVREADVFEALAPLGGHRVVLDAAASPGGHFSPVFHLASAAETVADTIDIAARYLPLVWHRLRVRTHLTHETVVMAFDPVPDHPGAHLLMQFVVAEMCWATIHLLSQQRFRALRVELPGAVDDDERWEGLAEVMCFGAARARIVVARSDLDRPCRRPDPRLTSWLRYVLDQKVSALSATAPLRQEVVELVRRRLRLPPDRRVVAATLGMTQRTLARRLSREGTSFRAIVDEVRFEAAQQWVRELPSAEVAARLGFSDARSFQRAFKRWAGETPGAWARRREASRCAVGLGVDPADPMSVAIVGVGPRS